MTTSHKSFPNVSALVYKIMVDNRGIWRPHAGLCWLEDLNIFVKQRVDVLCGIHGLQKYSFLEFTSRRKQTSS